MRLYHFLKAEHALDDIKNKRIKISLIPDLNDPFEINSVPLPTAEHRKIWRSFVQDFGKRFGVICFCRKWDNPLLWSHYAEKHYGVCLGFDVTPYELADSIRYRKSMLPFTLDTSHKTGGLGENEMRQILMTKYSDWKYEDEVRILAKLEKSELDSTGLNKQFYFANFGQELQLREVIVGVRSKVTKNELENVLEEYQENVTLIKERLAFNSFRVIRNKKGFITYRQVE